MKPVETIRYARGDCQIVFDLTLAPMSECAEGGMMDVEEADPTCCPFCGSAELKAKHDRMVFTEVLRNC